MRTRNPLTRTRGLQAFIMMLAATALLFTVGSGASASGKAAGTSPETVTITLAAVPQVDSPEVRQLTGALQAGQQVILQTPGGRSATLTLSEGVIQVVNATVSEPASSIGAYGWCAASWATAFFAIGAITLGTIAALGGSIVVLGVVFAGARLASVAALSGSFAAYYAWADSKLC
jgi:hypothetical protein